MRVDGVDGVYGVCVCVVFRESGRGSGECHVVGDQNRSDGVGE